MIRGFGTRLNSTDASRLLCAHPHEWPTYSSMYLPMERLRRVTPIAVLLNVSISCEPGCWLGLLIGFEAF